MRIAHLAALAVLVSFPVTVSAGPPLSDYAIFAATDRVVIGAGSSILALPTSPTPVVGSGYSGSSYAAIFLNGAASVQGDMRSAGNVSLQNGTSITGTIYHAAGTTLTHGNPYFIGGEVIGDPELPAFPPASPCVSGGPSYNLGNSQVLTLAPGSYGSVHLGGACTLDLSSGVYSLGDLKSGNGLRLNVDLSGGPIQVYVCAGGGGSGYVDFGSVTTVLVAGAGGDPNLASTMIRFEAQGTSPTGWSFEASGSSTWLGDVVTPNGSIHYGGSGCCSLWTGHFHAYGQVDVEHAVTGELPPVPAAPMTWGRVKVQYR